MLEGLTVGAGFGAAVCTVAGIRHYLRSQHGKTVERGNTMRAELPAEYDKPTAERRYLFGNRWLNFDEARKHFLIVGSTGSGKTVNINILAKHVVRHQAKPGSNARLMVYDSKTDIISTLATLMEQAAKEHGQEDQAANRLVILNPFDARCSAWDIARDIEDASMAEDVAAILVPEQPNATNPFFSRTAQRLLEGIITAFIENAPGEWTLRDVIEATKTKARLRAVFESCEDTIALLDFFQPEDTFNDVLSTLTGNLLGYRVIAAAWEIAREEGKQPDGGNSRVVSLEEWLASDRVLVLGNNTRKKQSISRLNQLLFSEATKVLLDKPGQESNGETWFFLDEVAELGKMETLGDLMNRGRSKGAAVVLGFQDIGDMDAVYQKDRARSIVGAAQNVAFLHINDAQDETQRWASKVVGEAQLTRENRGRSSSSSTQPTQYGYQVNTSQSDNTSEQVVTEPAWLPSQFGSSDPKTGLPPTNGSYGMKGLYRVATRWVQQHFEPAALFTDTTKHNHVPRGDASRIPDIVNWSEPPKLANWSPADAERLGIASLAELLAIEPKAKDQADATSHEDKLRSIRNIRRG